MPFPHNFVPPLQVLSQKYEEYSGSYPCNRKVYGIINEQRSKAELFGNDLWIAMELFTFEIKEVDGKMP